MNQKQKRKKRKCLLLKKKLIGKKLSLFERERRSGCCPELQLLPLPLVLISKFRRYKHLNLSILE